MNARRPASRKSPSGVSRACDAAGAARRARTAPRNVPSR
jgi:hypothetical protein